LPHRTPDPAWTGPTGRGSLASVIRPARWVSGGASLLVALIALLSLMGWALQIETLIRVRPQMFPMVPLTGVGLLLGALALTLLRDPAGARWRTHGGVGCAAILALIGATVLFEYRFGVDSGLARLLFPDPVSRTGTSPPGQPAQNSALGMVLYAMGLLLLATKGHRSVTASQLVALSVLLLTLPSLIGYLYGLETFYRFTVRVPMALHTAIAFVLLALGLLFARPDRGLAGHLTRNDIGGRVARWLLPTAVVLPTLAGLMSLMAQRAGIVDAILAATLLDIAMIVIFSSIVWWNVARIQRIETVREESLHRAREAQHAHQAVRRELEALLHSTGEGIYGIDAEGRVTFLNRAGAELVGHSMAETIGRNMHRLIHHSRADGTTYPEAECPISGTLRTGKGVRVEQDVLWRKDGSAFPAEYSSFPVLREGRIVGAVVTFSDVTDRRRGEERLRRSERRLRLALEAGGMGTWEFDHSTRRAVTDARHDRMFGLEPAGAESDMDRFMERVHPEDRRLVEEGLARAATEGLGFDLEFRTVQPDGTTRWVSGKGESVPVERGGGVMFGVIFDVTERREAEEMRSFLYDASAELSGTLDDEEALRRVARLAVPRLSDSCIVHRVDPVTGQVTRTGFARDVVAGDSRVRELVPGASADLPAAEPVAEVLRGGEARLIRDVPPELLETIAGDPERPGIVPSLGATSAVIAPLRVRNQVLGTITLVMTRRSGRRFDERDLDFARELADRAALAVDNARLYGEAARRAREEEALRRAVAAVNASFTIGEATRTIAESALRATGSDGAFVERMDADGSGLEVVATAGSVVPSLASRRPYADSWTEEVVERQQPVLIPRIADTRRGLPGGLQERWGDCAAAILPLLHAGRAVGALFLMRTPEHLPFRADEIERASTFIQLASLAFRKIDLIEDAQRRAEELQRLMASREHLVRGFSHDLKNPLGAADGQLQLMEMGIIGKLTPRQAESVGRSRGSIGRALELIEDLTELARAEAEAIEIHHEPVDVRSVVQEAAEEHRAAARAKGLRMDVELPPELPVLESDASRIRQVLGNLLSNAVKYTRIGGVTLRVAKRHGPDAPGDGDWVSVEVADTGVGIADDERHRLFREFVRLDPALETGWGIGLAISRHLAHALGGEISVESAPGHGSTFTLWLPCGDRREQSAGGRER